MKGRLANIKKVYKYVAYILLAVAIITAATVAWFAPKDRADVSSLAANISFEQSVNVKYYKTTLSDDDWFPAWKPIGPLEKETSYSAGDYVTYGGNVYLCTTAPASPSPEVPEDLATFIANTNCWSVVSSPSAWSSSQTYALGAIVSESGRFYISSMAGNVGNMPSMGVFASNWSEISAWSNSADYSVGDYVLDSDNPTYVYQCTTDPPGTSPDFGTEVMDYWTQGPAVGNINAWNSNTTYNIGSIVSRTAEGDTVYYVSKANNNTGHDPSGGLVWTEIVANDTTTVTNGKIDIKSFYPGEQDVYKMVATVPSSGLFNMIVKDIDVYSGSDPVAVNTPRFTEQTTPKRSEILSCIGLYAVAVDKDGNQVGSTVLTNLNSIPSSNGIVAGIFPSASLSAGTSITVYYDFFIDGNANQAIHDAIREIGARVIIDKVTIAHVS